MLLKHLQILKILKGEGNLYHRVWCQNWMVPCLVGEGEGTEELREVGKVAVLESVSDCGHDPRVVPLALAVHRVSLYVHQFTCTCVCVSYTPFKTTTEKWCGTSYKALLKLTEIVWEDTDSKTVVLVNFESVCNPVKKRHTVLFWQNLLQVNRT